MYCKYCGKEIANDSVFCQFCGKSLIESMSDNKEIESHDDINKSSENETYNVGTDDKTQEVIIKTKEDAPLHVEISKKKENHSSTIANEIVGNLKMIGLAIIMTLSYILLFSLIRIDCIIGLKNPDNFGKGFYDKKIIKSYYHPGRSQSYLKDIEAPKENNSDYFYSRLLKEKYDQMIARNTFGIRREKYYNDLMNFLEEHGCNEIINFLEERGYRDLYVFITEHFYNENEEELVSEKQLELYEITQKLDLMIWQNPALGVRYSNIVHPPHHKGDMSPSSSDFTTEWVDGSIERLEKELNITDNEKEELKRQAKSDLWEAQKSMKICISRDRKEYFKSDFEEHSKYAIIISFILTIVGRYFIKLFRWVNINKT